MRHAMMVAELRSPFHRQERRLAGLRAAGVCRSCPLPSDRRRKNQKIVPEEEGRMDSRWRKAWAAVITAAVGGAAVVSTPAARAAEPASSEQTYQDQSTTASPPPAERSPFGEKYYPAAPPTQRRPLMSLLERQGLSKPLDDARIRVFGHVEVGYTFNPDDPAQDLNLGRVFDVESNQATFNQLDLG